MWPVFKKNLIQSLKIMKTNTFTLFVGFWAKNEQKDPLFARNPTNNFFSVYIYTDVIYIMLIYFFIIGLDSII